MAPYWWTLRAKRPRVAAACETARIALLTPVRTAAHVRALQDRIQRLEHDVELLTAHVAALGARPSTGTAHDRENDLVAVRLGAIAFYEERIQALERSTRVRRAGADSRRADHSATVGETRGE